MKCEEVLHWIPEVLKYWSNLLRLAIRLNIMRNREFTYQVSAVNANWHFMSSFAIGVKFCILGCYRCTGSLQNFEIINFYTNVWNFFKGGGDFSRFIWTLMLITNFLTTHFLMVSLWLSMLQLYHFLQYVWFIAPSLLEKKEKCNTISLFIN